MSGPTHFVELNEDSFLQEAVTIVDKARERSLELRILGALAVYAHSLDQPENLELYKTLPRFGEGKPLFTDLDLAGYKKQRQDVMKLLQELRFKPDNMLNALFGGKRLMYYHPEDKYHVDVFFDKLEFSHEINFGEKPGSGRLDMDYPTITLADIVLEKLQIHQINQKDIIDLIFLFLGHNVEDHQKQDTVDGKYISGILSDDWGFFHDATTNLDKVKVMTSTLLGSAKLSSENASTINTRIDKIRKLIEDAPKTKKWEKRSQTGTNKLWYREIDEVVR